MLTVLVWAIVIYLGIGLIGGPFLIGKERKPMTAGDFLVVLIVGLLIIWLLTVAYLT